MSEGGSAADGRPDERRLEAVFLGGARRYTRLEAADRAGVSIELAGRLWQAMGFANLPDDEVAFTDGDVRALTIAGEQVRRGVFDEDSAVRLARAMGHAMARLAESEIEIITQAVREPGKPLTDEELAALVDYVEETMPSAAELVVHVWRRQLAASGTRSLSAAAAHPEAPSAPPLGVGFADIESFTEVSRTLDEAELTRLVEGFESVAADIIAAHHGRLVKTLGDEVLFAADDPVAVTEIGLDLAEAMDTPRVRVGLAYGPVLPVMGDVFGTTVNLASRITAMARPGAVLCDTGLADALAAGDATRRAYRVVPILRRRARGLGIVQPHVVRRGERAGNR